MLSKNELKFLEFIFEKTLEDIESFIDQTNILRLKTSNTIQEIKYKLVKTHYYLFLILSLFFYDISSFFPFLKIFNCELLVFISIVMLIPATFLDNKMKKMRERLAIITDFIRLKKRIEGYKTKIDTVFQFHIIHEFENLSELKKYHQLIEEKADNTSQSLKNFIRGYISSTFLSPVLLVSISLFLVFLINLDLFGISIVHHIIILLLLSLNKILPTLLDIDFIVETRIENVIKIVTNVEEYNEYPNKLIMESLDNYSFYNFNNFDKQLLCYNCLNMTQIKSIDEKEIYCCNHCNHSTDIRDKIIFIKSFNLKFYCIRCGYLNLKLMESPFNKKIICQNCLYESNKIEYPQLVEILVRILGKKDKIGLVFISLIPSKNQFLSFSFIYYDFQLLEPILKLIPIEIEKKKLLRLPLSILKDISTKGQNRYPLVQESIEFKSCFPSSLTKIKKAKLKSIDYDLFNESHLNKTQTLVSNKNIQIIQKIKEIDAGYADINNSVKNCLLEKLNDLADLEFQNFVNFIKLIEFINKFNIKNYEIDSILRESADKFWKTNKKKTNSKMYMEKRWFHDKLYEAFLNEFGEVVSREIDRVGGKVDFEVLKIPIETKVLNDRNYPNSSAKSGLEILRSLIPQLFQYISLTRCGLIIGYDYRQEKIKREYKRLAPSECIFVETEEKKIIFGILLIGNKEKPSDYPSKKVTTS